MGGELGVKHAAKTYIAEQNISYLSFKNCDVFENIHHTSILQLQFRAYLEI